MLAPGYDNKDSELVCGFSISRLKWANLNVTFSFIPNNTKVHWGTSNLFKCLNHLGRDNWQYQIRRAVKQWEKNSVIDFKYVEDDGSPESFGLKQGDTRFGDIRIGAVDMDIRALAATVYPSTDPGYGGTDVGNIFLNTKHIFSIGEPLDLCTIMMHEIGHALGINHSKAGTVMYGTYQHVFNTLTQDDINAVHSMYGKPPKEKED